MPPLPNTISISTLAQQGLAQVRQSGQTPLVVASALLQAHWEKLPEGEQRSLAAHGLADAIASLLEVERHQEASREQERPGPGHRQERLEKGQANGVKGINPRERMKEILHSSKLLREVERIHRLLYAHS